MAPALTASDFQMCWTWTLCRRGGYGAGAADVNKVVAVSEAATGLRSPLGPGASWNSARSLGSIMESACGFTARFPEAAEAAPARNFGA